MGIASGIRFLFQTLILALFVTVLAFTIPNHADARCGNCEGDFESENEQENEPEPPAPEPAPEPQPSHEGESSIRCDLYTVRQILDLDESQLSELFSRNPYAIVIKGFDRGPSQLLLSHLLTNREEAAAILLAASSASSLAERNRALDGFAASIQAEIAQLTASGNAQDWPLLMQAYSRLLTINSIRNSPLVVTVTGWCR